MNTHLSRLLPCLLLSAGCVLAAEDGWKQLVGDAPKDAWQFFAEQWIIAGSTQRRRARTRRASPV